MTDRPIRRSREHLAEEFSAKDARNEVDKVLGFDTYEFLFNAVINKIKIASKSGKSRCEINYCELLENAGLSLEGLSTPVRIKLCRKLEDLGFYVHHTSYDNKKWIYW